MLSLERLIVNVHQQAQNDMSVSRVQKVPFLRAKLFEALRGKALMAKELTLTHKGLSLVNWDRGDDDFEFVGGDDRVCRVHSVLAEFLSPKVARVRKTDPLFCVYSFKNDCSQTLDVLKSLISSLRSGRDFIVEPSNFLALLRLSQELDNAELFSSLLGMIKPESLTVNEALLLLKVEMDLGVAFSAPFGNLRDFIASHFYELEKEILDNLDLETTQILLSSPSLQIEDEDSLYDFVHSRSETDLRFAHLFEFVYFQYLSVDRIENFSSFVSENFLANISSGIWTRICARLILNTKLKRNPRTHKGTAERELVYDSSKKLDGIIASLTRQYGGNVHDKGIVNITAESSSYHDEPPKNVADLGTSSRYASEDKENQWICYDFKDRTVAPTSYSIMSQDSGHGGNHLRAWVLEGSNDGDTWTILDKRDNNCDLNASLVTCNFQIAQPLQDGFRFIRLRQTGKNNGISPCYTMRFSSLEIFGVLSGD